MQKHERLAIQRQITKLKSTENIVQLVFQSARTVGETSTAYQLHHEIKEVRESLEALISSNQE